MPSSGLESEMAEQKTVRRSHTADQREGAVALAGKSGPTNAASELGIPKMMLCRWVIAAREAAVVDATPWHQPTTEAKARVQKRYTPSQKAEFLEFASTHTVGKAAKRFGVSKFSIYEWRRRVERAARGAGDSPTSGPDPADVEAVRDREILNE